MLVLASFVSLVGARTLKARQGLQRKGTDYSSECINYAKYIVSNYSNNYNDSYAGNRRTGYLPSR